MRLAPSLSLLALTLGLATSLACRKPVAETEPVAAAIAPAPKVVEPPPPAPPPAPPTALVTVYFDFDRSEIRADQLAGMRQTLASMQADAQLRVRIEGHCDERGTTDYNLALGERRASAVRAWLVANGVAASRITTLSYGEERPAVVGHDEAAWARNRRAEPHPSNTDRGPLSAR